MNKLMTLITVSAIGAGLLAAAPQTPAATDSTKTEKTTKAKKHRSGKKHNKAAKTTADKATK